ncbi:helix-turn-helix domain-containing protein [Bacillus thuringiensis]|uniref:helix-turn-helix domain-containing protein n=1 Tax=Bacillus thuringiensis TaxID=1428 RepID=UPI0011A56272|nr:helix-turn-helix transcriptional regulator [Bacillus thuringiensis]
MIRSNLGKLLEKENLSINKVSTDTGISRQTITSLVHNESKGIQFNTLETLMAYLGVQLNDLLIDDVGKIVFNSRLCKQEFHEPPADKTEFHTYIEVHILENENEYLVYLEFDILNTGEFKGILIIKLSPPHFLKNQPNSIIKLMQIFNNISFSMEHKIHSHVFNIIAKSGAINVAEYADSLNKTFLIWDLPNLKKTGILETKVINKKIVIFSETSPDLLNDYDKKIRISDNIHT